MTPLHDVTGSPVVRSYRAKWPPVQVPNEGSGNFSDVLLERSSIRQFRREVKDRSSGDEMGVVHGIAGPSAKARYVVIPPMEDDHAHHGEWSQPRRKLRRERPKGVNMPCGIFTVLRLPKNIRQNPVFAACFS